MRKASTWMLEKGTQTPSPSPDHIPAQNHKLLLRTYMETGTSNGGTSLVGLVLLEHDQLQSFHFEVLTWRAPGDL